MTSEFFVDFKVQKDIFKRALEKDFSITEIQQIWRQILIHFLSISPIEQVSMGSHQFSAAETKVINNIVQRLHNKEPFQHIIGEVEFYGLELKSDARGLIPRPETEELVDWVVNDQDFEPSNILDVCSGSGCITLALSQLFPNAQVSGIENSRNAISLAEENAISLKLPVQFKESDVLNTNQFKNTLKDLTKKVLFDVIVSNPPYIPQAEKKNMDLVVLNHEPNEALFVPDDDPLVFYRAIAKAVLPFLSTSGAIYFECHYLHLENTRKLLIELGFNRVEKRKDMQGKWRMLKARK
jgi:release factor glutamine methyltransferase